MASDCRSVPVQVFQAAEGEPRHTVEGVARDCSIHHPLLHSPPSLPPPPPSLPPSLPLLPLPSLPPSLPPSPSQLPEDFEVVYSQVQGEVVVGGVFLRLFIAQPTWVLRKPKEFLIALLEKFGQLTQSSNPDVSVHTFTPHSHLYSSHHHLHPSSITTFTPHSLYPSHHHLHPSHITTFTPHRERYWRR